MIPSIKGNDATLRLVVDDDLAAATDLVATLRVRHQDGGWKQRIRVPVGKQALPVEIPMPAGVFSLDLTLPSGTSISEAGRIEAGGEATVTVREPSSVESRAQAMLETLESAFAQSTPGVAAGSFASRSAVRLESLRAVLGDEARMRCWRWGADGWEPSSARLRRIRQEHTMVAFLPASSETGLLLAEIRAGGSGHSEFCCVPADSNYRDVQTAGFAVVASAERDANDAARRLRWHTTFDAPDLRAFSASLIEGACGESPERGNTLSEQVMATLSHLSDRPWQAAAAALAALKSRHIALTEAWTLELAERFSWLPDGAVIRAWHLLLHSSDRRMAQTWLIEASRRGLPQFTEGLRLLVAGLRLCGPSLDDHARRWESYLWASDADEVLTSFRGPHPAKPRVAATTSDDEDDDASGEWQFIWRSPHDEWLEQLLPPEPDADARRVPDGGAAAVGGAHRDI